MAAASIATAPRLLSIEKYLNTTYRTDVDFVDGRVEERNMGDTHSKVQGKLYFLLRLHAGDWRVLILPEVRVQVSPTRFVIPISALSTKRGRRTYCAGSSAALHRGTAATRSVTEMRGRVQDYLDMGVSEVWIFDPQDRTA